MSFIIASLDWKFLIKNEITHGYDDSICSYFSQWQRD